MLEQIKENLKKEENQRAILNATGLVVTFVATRVFAHYMDMGVNLGIDQIIAKLHPQTESEG